MQSEDNEVVESEIAGSVEQPGMPNEIIAENQNAQEN